VESFDLNYTSLEKKGFQMELYWLNYQFEVKNQFEVKRILVERILIKNGI